MIETRHGRGSGRTCHPAGNDAVDNLTGWSSPYEPGAGRDGSTIGGDGTTMTIETHHGRGSERTCYPGKDLDTVPRRGLPYKSGAGREVQNPFAESVARPERAVTLWFTLIHFGYSAAGEIVPRVR